MTSMFCGVIFFKFHCLQTSVVTIHVVIHKPLKFKLLIVYLKSISFVIRTWIVNCWNKCKVNHFSIEITVRKSTLIQTKNARRDLSISFSRSLYEQLLIIQKYTNSPCFDILTSYIYMNYYLPSEGYSKLKADKRVFITKSFLSACWKTQLIFT